MAILSSEELLAELEKGSIAYASAEIGKSIVLAYKDLIVKQVKPEDVVNAVRDFVAVRLAETLEFNIKKEEDAPKA
jgi:hypothetical protein